jgi:preprotein translocase subunit SecB
MQAPKKDFSEFFESLELADIVVVESSAWRATDLALPADVHMENSVSIEQGASGKWMATCKYDLSAVAAGKEDAGLKISITYSASYMAAGNMDDQAREFLSSNATMATWPYVRLHVRSVTSEMGLAPLIIGLFKVKFNPPAPEDSRKPAKKPSKAAVRKQQASRKA